MCQADLSDPSVPEEYEAHRAQFGVAKSITTSDGKQRWMCPFCEQTWPRK